MRLLYIVTLLVKAAAAAAFVSPCSRSRFPSVDGIQGYTPFVATNGGTAFLHPSVHRQRKSVTNIQTAGGLFGLGIPEVAIIVAAGLFVLGPEKISEMVRASGQVAGELKDELRDVPAEFKKGLEEGEINARSTKAKKMEPLPKDD